MSEKQTVKGLLGAKLDEYLTHITPFGFSGALLVAKEDKAILNKGYGMAIREKGIPNTHETVFCTGSITKQFTAAAITRLWMIGKLDTNDRIDNYLRDVPQDKRVITLHNLLTHTAGLVDFVGDDYEEVCRDEFVRRVLNEPLRFKPGTAYEYSNAGYGLLATIIEIVSSQPYEEFLHEQLFAPSEMSFTGYRIPDWNKRVVAEWYVEEVNNKNSLAKAFPHWNLVGNGGVLSTTGDMFKWHLALKGESILSQRAKEKMFTPFLNNYAYGWDVSETEHGRQIAHDGGNDLGATADFKWFVNHDIATILLCNQFSTGALLAMQVRDKIVNLVFGGTIQVPPAVTEHNRDLKKFEGIYCLTPGECFTISFQNGLLLEAKGQKAIDTVLPPDHGRTVDGEKLNRRTLAICERILKGDFDLLLDELEDKSTFDRKRRFVDSVLRARELGSVMKIEVLGTLPYPRRENAFETVVRIEFEKRSLLFSLIWHDGKLWGMPGRSNQPIMPLKPISKSKFAGYHLGLARGTVVDFILNSKGNATGLTVNGKTAVATGRIDKPL